MHIFAMPPQTATKALLSSCNLPTQDLTDEHFKHFFGCGRNQELDGVVGVEIYGAAGLLRSLAVAEQARGLGCGKRLIQEAELHAANQGVQEIYLLTSTARSLFESLGYTAIPRDAAPPSIRVTKEFASICPSSATLMRKQFPTQP